jgi:hypothetical protein
MRLQDHIDRLAPEAVCAVKTNQQNGIDLRYPEIILDPLRQAGSGDFLHSILKPYRREFGPNSANAVHYFGVRSIPAEDTLDEYIVNYLLPKLWGDPLEQVIRWPVLEYFM